MKVTCISCGAKKETKTDMVYVTVSWMLEKIYKLNNLIAKEFPRVSMVCDSCWNSYAKKPEGSNYYWTYHNEI